MTCLLCEKNTAGKCGCWGKSILRDPLNEFIRKQNERIMGQLVTEFQKAIEDWGGLVENDNID